MDSTPSVEELAAILAGLQQHAHTLGAAQQAVSSDHAAFLTQLAVLEERLRTLEQQQIELEQLRQMKVALHVTEERYRTLFENANDIIYTHDFAGNFTSANALACQTYGYTLEEILHRNIRDLIDPDHLTVALEQMQKKIKGAERSGPYQLLTRCKDGSPVWVEVNTTLLRHMHQAVGIQGIARDITSRKKAEWALQQSEANLRAIFDTTNQSIILLAPDYSIIAFNKMANSSARLIHGSAMQVGDALQVHLSPEDRAPFEASFQKALGGTVQTAERALLAADGKTYTWEFYYNPIAAQDGQVTGVLFIARNVTEYKEAEQQLRLHAAALKAAANAVVITDPSGVITWVNPAFTTLTGYTSHEAIGQSMRLLHSGMQDATFYEALWDTIRSGNVWRSELVNRRKDGSLYTEEQVITPVYNSAGQISHYIDIKQDISERKQHDQLLGFLAMHDSLTGLYNRLALEQALERVVSLARRGTASALLFLDLDNFKLINDTLGHAVGDELLVMLTLMLAEQLREGDLLARIGGDGFAVLLEDTRPDTARQLAEHLREVVDKGRFPVGGQTFTLGLSVGLVAIDGQADAQALLAQAGTALYSAKERGRNQVVVYHPEDTDLMQLSEANRWVMRIKDALREERLVLYAQPIVRLSDGKIAHHELLIRIRDEEGGLILPGAFIAAAERFGLMPPLDRWVIREAVRALRDQPQCRLFINLSGHSRVDETLVAYVEEQLHEHNVAPERLGFEITETAAVQDLLRAERWIRRLKALGCGFALDDFGVGFTSFAYLRTLPVDQIKIDGTFIRTINQDASSRDIVQAMHTLASALGKETVAEYVESAAILHTLRAIGIHYGQGYHLGKPHPLCDLGA